MSDAVGLRELRNDIGAIMRRVEQGESFVVTLNGRPIADLVPHARSETRPERTLAELRAVFACLPPADPGCWRTERAAADQIFGDDDPAG